MTTVVVVGASRGIGLAFASLFATPGHRVICTVRSTSSRGKLEELQAASTTEGVNVEIMELDISNENSIKTWAQALSENCQSVDLLINNAALSGSHEGMMDICAADMISRFQTNTIGPLVVTQQLHARQLLKAGSLVVMLSSIMGSIADDTLKALPALPYRCSKVALNMLAKHINFEIEKVGAKCIAMHPGFVKTDATADRGQMTPGESVAQMQSVFGRDSLEGGAFYSYSGDKLPW